MDNENNVKISKFGRVLFAPDVPALYGQGLTDYEILCRLARVINDNAAIMESWYNVEKELEKILTDFDETVKAEVIKTIQELYESGELDDVISEAITQAVNSALAPKQFKIDTRREFRVCLGTREYNDTTINVEKYSYCQGSHYFIKNGIHYYVACYLVSNSDNLYYKNDNADVRLYGYIDGKWNFIRNRIYSLGHANSIIYVPEYDYFFVTRSSEYNGGSSRTESLQIHILDWELSAYPVANMSFTSTDFTPNLNGVTGLDYHNGTFYVYRGSGGENPVQIYTFELTDNFSPINVTPYATIYFPYTTGTSYTMLGAGMCQNDDFIFLGSTAPAGIFRFNKTTKQLDNFYEIGAYTNSHMCATGEVEDLSIVGNNIYISTAIHGNQRNNYFDFNQVFVFDYVNNLTIPSGEVTPYGSFNRVIYVGDVDRINNVDYWKREISNPNGLTGVNGMPFTNWEEVTLFLSAQNKWHDIAVTPITVSIAGYLALDVSNVAVEINGTTCFNDSRNTGSDYDKMPTINGIYINGGNLYLSQVKIINRTPEEYSDTYTMYQINAVHTVLLTRNVLLHPYQRPEGHKYMYLNECIANLGACLNYQENTISFNEDNISIYISTVNTHGNWSGSATSNVIA